MPTETRERRPERQPALGSKARCLSVVLADDHQVVREGIRSLISSEPDIEIVAEANDGLDAVNKVAEYKPHVLVLDLVMPSIHGLEVLRQVGSRSPATRVVVLSLHEDDAYVLQAMRNGALAYVNKGSGSRDLISAIREVAAGRYYISLSDSERDVQSYLDEANKEVADPYEALTNREREVLHLAANGMTNRKIARALTISRRTVEAYRATARRKLGLGSHSDVIRYIVERESPHRQRPKGKSGP